MRYNQLFIPTLKDEPSDAQVASHKLMLRAGMISKVASGIYNILPIGLRVFQKISAIIRQEMQKAQAQEVFMPMVQPAELWQESGRWQEADDTLLKLKDRKKTDFCLGPTHEEIVTALVRSHIKSYRQLPLTLFQIQTKFRDELRPKYGLMRGREFLMKDAYSFASNAEGALQTYYTMYATYERIFKRCSLKVYPVQADTGSIGGNLSHEFHILADAGEDTLTFCAHCGYAANVELATISSMKPPSTPPTLKEKEAVWTPGKGSIEEVADYLGIPSSGLIKSMMFLADEKPVMVLCRGDHHLNEIKVKRALSATHLQLMPEEEIQKWAGPQGFMGPLRITEGVKIWADTALQLAVDLVAGAGLLDYHMAHVTPSRDFIAEFVDLRIASPGDLCATCQSPLSFQRGIELGHVFYLGTKYSKPMHATFLDAQGQQSPLEMGCYGMGVSRTVAAIIEQFHDENGIKWPIALTPFHVALVQLGDNPQVISTCEALYAQLEKRGIEVLYDDRAERPGVKLKDHDLIGCPLRILVSPKSIEGNYVELKPRDSRWGESVQVPVEKCIPLVEEKIKEMEQELIFL